MNEIQELFDDLIAEKTNPETFLGNYIRDEFEKIKIDLESNQLINLVKQIYPNPQGSISINLSDEQLDAAGYINEEESKKDVRLIFESLTEGISKKIKIFNKEFPEIVLNSANEIADYLLNKIYDELDLHLAPHQFEHDQLIRGINEIWGNSLDLLEALITTSLEAGDKYHNENVQISDKNNYLYEALFRLHAKACQTSSEILTLLRSGFADGAHARWRSLHEISIISYFISEHGNNVAKRYLDYQIVESYKAAIQFQEYAEILGQEKIPDSKMAEIYSDIQELDEKYGSEYKKGGYGWASSILNKNKLTFRDIEESIDLDHFRPYYKMASYNVHAGSKSLFFRLGLHETDTVLLAGPSNLGLVEPCRFTAISLSQITTNLILKESPNMDTIVTSRMLMKLEKKIENTVVNEEKLFLESVEKKRITSNSS